MLHLPKNYANQLWTQFRAELFICLTNGRLGECLGNPHCLFVLVVVVVSIIIAFHLIPLVSQKLCSLPFSNSLYEYWQIKPWYYKGKKMVPEFARSVLEIHLYYIPIRKVEDKKKNKIYRHVSKYSLLYKIIRSQNRLYLVPLCSRDPF